MALLNRPMTDNEARAMLRQWKDAVFTADRSTFRYMLDQVRLDGPWPHFVRYHVALTAKPRPFHVPPTRYARHHATGPSDCIWQVPNSTGYQMPAEYDAPLPPYAGSFDTVAALETRLRSAGFVADVRGDWRRGNVKLCVKGSRVNGFYTAEYR